MTIRRRPGMGYALLQRGARALAQVEAHGIRVDEKYLATAITETETRIKLLESELANSDVSRAWRRMFGAKTNLDSRAQLGKVLVAEIGAELGTTETGQVRTDEESLSQVDHPFIRNFLQIAKLKKLASTYLRGIQREVQDGYVHPFFHLHFVRTFRSSSEKPNFQNVPVRDPESGQLIRRIFIPRKGRVLIECDYKGIEVAVAACYNKDPALIRYVKDPKLDMHRDMAMELFELPQSEITKAIRHAAKNQFVFPQFYGDFYIDCARQLWDSAGRVATASGVPLRKHLATRGYPKLGRLDPKKEPEAGSFEGRVRLVEKNFWDRRFRVYRDWKRSWYDAYKRRGWIRTLTGFVCQGYMKRNDAINYGIQGSAFHCLLWSLARLVLDEIPDAGLESLIIGQIHDSLLGDVPEREVDDYRTLVQDVMVDQLMAEWDWIIVPLVIELTESSSSWAEMKG